MGLNEVLRRGGHDATGVAIDLRIDRDTGLVVARGPSVAADGADVIDCEGHVLLPAPAEPHAHLDKAYTVDDVINPSGDLAGALAAYDCAWPAIEPSDIVRATPLGDGTPLPVTPSARALRPIDMRIAESSTNLLAHDAVD